MWTLNRGHLAPRRTTIATTRVRRVFSSSWTKSTTGRQNTTIVHRICPPTCPKIWRTTLPISNRRRRTRWVSKTWYYQLDTFDDTALNLAQHNLGLLRGWKSRRSGEHRNCQLFTNTWLPRLFLSLSQFRGLLESPRCRALPASQTWVYHIYQSYTYIYIYNTYYLLSGGIIINVECKAWARNIIHDRKERIGSVHYELLID